jgi:iron complex outermembrane receptor protein
MNTRATRQRAGARRPVVAAIALALSGPAWSQTLPNEEIDEAAELGKIEITGSRIKRLEVEGPAPVIVVTREEIDKMGYQTFQEVLDGLTQNTGGSFNQSFVFGFTPGASAIQLRGFAPGYALILLDGRRLPVYPLSIGGVANFVDTSNIPTALIERIEILTDGASAIYGSDAISGVINIITRKDFEGLDVQLRYSDTFDGGYQTNRTQVIAGTSSAKTSIQVIAEHFENDELLARDRDFVATDIANPRGNYSVGGASFIDFNFNIVQAPGCGTEAGPLGGLGIPDQTIPFITATDTWCAFDRAQFRQLFPENERIFGQFRVDHQLTPDVSLFARMGFVQADTFTMLEPNFYGGSVLFGGASATPIVPNSSGGLVSPGAANFPAGATAPGVFVRRLIEFGPRTSDIETITWGALAGAEGFFDNGWEWEVGFQYNLQDVTSRRPNIILSALENEIANNGLDLFQPIPQDVVDNLRYTATTDGRSTSLTYDLSLTGDTPVELPGGPLAFAVIYDFQRETFEDIRDPITIIGDNFDGGSSGAGSRDHYGIGLELGLPVLPTLNLGAAIRWDEYQDASLVGNAVSPRFTVGFRPTDTLLLRGSWGESFRAPDLQRLFGATTRAFQTLIDTPRCIADGGTGPGDPSVLSCTQQVQAVRLLIGANEALEEEEGENLNLGVVWEPIDGLSTSLDWYDIELEGIVATPTAQFILDQCGFFGNFCDNITRDPAGTLQGGLISANAQNLSLQSIQGLDFTFQYRQDTARFGNFATGVGVTWVDSLETQFDETSPATENVGLFSVPEYRANLTTDWTYGNHGATIRVSWIDEMPGVNASPDATGEVPKSQFTEDYLTVNAQYRYGFGRWGNLVVGVNNVFDEDPADDPTQNSFPFFINAGGFAVVQGREWFLQYTVGVF